MIPAAVMALMLLYDTSTLDFWFSDLFYVPGDGFVGRHSFFLEDILHDRVKQVVIVIGVLAIIGFVLSLLPTRLRRWRPELGYLVLSLALATSLVTIGTSVLLRSALRLQLISRAHGTYRGLGDTLQHWKGFLHKTGTTSY